MSEEKWILSSLFVDWHKGYGLILEKDPMTGIDPRNENALFLSQSKSDPDDLDDLDSLWKERK